MEHPLIRRLHWEIRWQLAHAGWPFWLGGLLSTVALGVYLLLAQPALHNAISSEQDAVRILAEADQTHARRPAVVEEDRLEAFYRNLPANDDLPSWLDALSGSAVANGIPFNQGDYRYVLEKDAKFGRYLVDLSLNGKYPALRGFLAEILDTMPFAGIEELTISRDGISSEVVEVQIRIALYFSSARKGQP